MTGLATFDRAVQVAPCAVAWIDGRRAVVAQMSRRGRVSTCEISRGWLPREAYLRQVVAVIGDRERLVILGPSSLRTQLEREYVSRFPRSDRLVDVEPSRAVGIDDLAARVRALAG